MSENDTPTMNCWEALKAPFKQTELRQRKQFGGKDNGKMLTYVTARTVMDRLDEAIGPHHWACSYTFQGNTVCCTLSINVGALYGEGDSWVGKADGAGETQIEGDKGLYTDAFKRAAVRWGVGRYLYDMEATAEVAEKPPAPAPAPAPQKQPEVKTVQRPASLPANVFDLDDGSVATTAEAAEAQHKGKAVDFGDL